MQYLRLFAALAALLLCPLTQRALAEVPSDKAGPTEAERLLATTAVFELFESKCNDCHGAHLLRPKGKFGYIMDLDRVVANDEYIVASHAEKSELFRLVNEDEMPGKEAKCGNATAAEKLALHAWIQMGAPTKLPQQLAERKVALLDSKTAQQTEVKPASVSLVEKLAAWVGRFHAASTHFPIGLLMAALLSESLAWWTRKESWLTCTRFLLFVGAGGALATATLGWLNAYAGVSQVYQLHKWLGTGTAAWSLMCLGAAIFYECREGTPERNRLRGALLLGAVLVSATGFLGGAIVYGLDHYNW
ncbi:MAG: DUF2231 domain-containing protein [Verrucomicrobiota bacterium]